APGQSVNSVRLGYPLVQMPIRQHQNLSVACRAGFEQLIAPEQPAGHQIGRSAVCNLLDRSDHSVAINRFLQPDNDLRGIIEHNKGKQVFWTQLRTTSAQASRANRRGSPAIDPDRSRTTANTAERGRLCVSNFGAQRVATRCTGRDSLRTMVL